MARRAASVGHERGRVGDCLAVARVRRAVRGVEHAMASKCVSVDFCALAVRAKFDEAPCPDCSLGNGSGNCGGCGGLFMVTAATATSKDGGGWRQVTSIIDYGEYGDYGGHGFTASK